MEGRRVLQISEWSTGEGSREMTRQLAVIATALLLTASMVTAVEVRVEGSEVVISTEPGAVVWFLSVVREEYRESYNRVLHVEERLEDEDADGEIRYDFGRRLPVLSIWVAIDEVTGESYAATPPGFSLRPPKRPVRVSENAVEVDGGSVRMFLLRPGVGAWSLRKEGRANPGVGPQGGGPPGLRVVAARPADLKPSRGQDGPPPGRFKPGDVLYTIDVRNLEITEVRF